MSINGECYECGRALSVWCRHCNADEIAQLEAHNAVLREALEEIANSPHLKYDPANTNSYGLGVVDGHRFCAGTAQRALYTTASGSLDRIRREGAEVAAKVDDALVDACAETLAAKFRVVWEDLPPFYTSHPAMKQAFSKHDFRTWSRTVLEKAATLRALHPKVAPHQEKETR